MDPVIVHLRLNHFPIIGLMVLFGLFAYAYFFRKRELFLPVKVGIVLLSLISIPLYLSGEPAEEKVEHLAGTNNEALEEHEDHAKKAFFFMELTGLICLISLWFGKNEKLERRIHAFLIPIIALTLFMMVITGMEGGKIRHTEIGTIQPEHPSPADMDEEHD